MNKRRLEELFELENRKSPERRRLNKTWSRRKPTKQLKRENPFFDRNETEQTRRKG